MQVVVNGTTVHPFKIDVILRGIGRDALRKIPVISYLINYALELIQ